MPGIVRKSTSGTVQLSPNFALSEFIESDTAVREGIDNMPNPVIVQHLFATAALLEKVRTILGNKTILVSSGYRCPALNTRVGGAASSDHTWGGAADFRCPSFGTPIQVATALVTAAAKGQLEFGQLIWEGTWVHIAQVSPAHRGDVLTARFVDGKAHYLPGIQP